MTKEQWKERLPLIQAFVRGKEIEGKTSEGLWTDMRDNIEFDSLIINYRIKPQPTLRPWKPEEVPVGAAFKSDDSRLPTAWIDTTPIGLVLGLYLHSKEVSYLSLAEHWKHSLDHGKTWLPCGVVK